MLDKISVNLISESKFGIRGGIYTAFLDMKKALAKRSDIEVYENSVKKTDIIHIHSIGPYSLFKYFTSRKNCVITSHILPASMVGSMRGTKLWLPVFTRYYEFFYNRAKLVISVSEHTKKELEKMKIKAPITVLPNGLNRERFKIMPGKRQDMRKKFSYSDKDFIVICVGLIQPRKGIITFYNLAKMLPDIKFVWAGWKFFKGMTENDREVEAILSNPPKNLFFPGKVEFDKMPDFYNMADLFFLPSHQETFGLVVSEAAACGIPVMLRDLEVYQSSFAPYYLAGQEEDFKKNIEKFSRDKDFYNEWRIKAKKIADKFDIEMVMNDLVALYRQVLRGS
jgi:1,2-diacylglycerol-3-alpha-glucose alpha-1,2-galactosyltransferase